jgi:ubiquinone/menaquinone biosynthesis C-methylase UbiE
MCLLFTLCTIPDYSAVLAQIHRVLKPGGKLTFCEHGAAADESVRQWQDRPNPLLKKLAGGCKPGPPSD